MNNLKDTVSFGMFSLAVFGLSVLIRQEDTEGSEPPFKHFVTP